MGTTIEVERDIESNVTTSESTVFQEEKAAFACIAKLTSATRTAATRTAATATATEETKENDADTVKGYDETLSQLRMIFDKYLELPSLLDRSIVRMVDELASSAGQILRGVTVEDFWNSSSSLPHILSAIYALSKVRGRKRVQKFLPHRVEDVEVVLRALRAVDSIESNDESVKKTQFSSSSISSATKTTEKIDGAPELWESIHTLWNWAGILSLIPFDSAIVVDLTMITELIELGMKHLSSPGPNREMAAACLASWLSRPDLRQTEFVRFRSSSLTVLTQYTTNGSTKHGDIFVTMGVLQTLVTILKISKADREIILDMMTPFWSVVTKITDAHPTNLLMRKYLTKWWTRLGCTYLPPRIATWRYQRGKRSLDENLSNLTPHRTDKALKESDAVSSPASDPAARDELFYVPDEVEEAMGFVISGLTDPSTAVRWAAAKGIGRITERLPAICAEDVLDAILEMFDDMEKDNDWHGACLALAELARRGLILSRSLSSIIPKLVEAINYDVPRRLSSVGAHVRDAACYTYWAFARAYEPSILAPFVPELSRSVVVAFLFDREINCRRAASAAFQECVGRQGANNFKHGISILTKADYFSLGNRHEAYTTIALHVAQFSEYRRRIIDQLYRVKSCHWDPTIRKLSSQSLKALTSLDKEYMVETVIPYLLLNSLDQKNVQLRHGSVLGLAEIILALGDMTSTKGDFTGLVPDEIMHSISGLVQTIEKKRLYRGKGGEQMRGAVCRLIECISIAKIPLTVPQQVRMLDSVDACLPHPSEEIQESAGLALYSLMRSYFPVGAKGPSDRLQKRVVDKYAKEVRTSINPAATRGFATALGRLPAKLLAPSSKVLDVCLSCLCRSARPDAKVGNDKDAETRRNAITALARICESVGVSPPKVSTENEHQCVVGLTPKQTGHVLTAMFRGLDDYNMERRGDVGSMSRIAAMHGLETLMSVMVQDPTKIDQHITTETSLKFIGGLLKQLSEKLDTVRSNAGNCLLRILHSPTVPDSYIIQKDSLLQALQSSATTKTGNNSEAMSINWADASVTYPVMVNVLEIDEYFDYVISGLVISVGCITQSISKHASASLVKWVKKSNKNTVARLGQTLLELFNKHTHDGRVILPLLKTLIVLMDKLCIDDLIQDDGFCITLLSCLQKEESDCKDFHRLSAIIHVAIGLIHSSTDTNPISFICNHLLCHTFPRVRRLTAENLYIRLLELSTDGNEILDDNHPAISLLLEHPWDNDGEAETTSSSAATTVATLLLGGTQP